MAAVRMGWACNLSAVASTGYLAGGPTNRFKVGAVTGQSTSFSERIPQLALMYRPDIVFLDGGRNDFQLPPDEVYDAIVWTIAGIRHAWPAATVVFIRPRFISRPEDNLGFDDGFIATLQADPAAHGIVVIDPLSRLTGSDTTDLLAPDQFHPNQHGEEVMSSGLVDSLVDRGFALQR
jgi:lysophospholipase L1-like esterase